MQRQEFEKRTGFYPTQEHYKVIEKYYIDFEGDKDAFCKAYKQNINGLAEKIQKEADVMAITSHQNEEKTEKQYEAQINELKKALEDEQEWKPYEDTYNVTQVDYKKLASQSDTKHMSDEEAKNLLYEWYGFAQEKIKIQHSVPLYEVNRHRRLRELRKLDRHPLYNATDWNYIRFDCGMQCYELTNGRLRPFSH